MTTINLTPTAEEAADPPAVCYGMPLVSRSQVGQVVTVGRSPDGIYLHATEAAAEVLAAVLARYDAAQSAFYSQPGHADPDYDTDLWVHVAVDLLAAKALNLHYAAAVTDGTTLARPLQLVDGAAAPR